MSKALGLVQFACIGTALLVAIGFALKLNKTIGLNDENDVISRLKVWDPDVKIAQIALDFDKKAALVRDENDQLIGLFVNGDRVSIRKFNDADIHLLGPERAYINPHDVGFPAHEFSAPSVSLKAIGLKSLATVVAYA